MLLPSLRTLPCKAETRCRNSAWNLNAETIAQHGMQGPCTTWVEKTCAGVMLQHFLLGFELDLYQPKEYCMLYW